MILYHVQHVRIVDMKIKCLFLDHDDTIVDSTKHIHYPAFCETLKQLRPNDPIISYLDFVDYCHRFGFMDLCLNKYAFNNDEMKIEYQIWKSFTRNQIPDVFDGLTEILSQFKKQGGIIVVISHSEAPEIKRDYLQHFKFEPDAIYGWERAEHERKPHSFPIMESLKILV